MEIKFNKGLSIGFSNWSNKCKWIWYIKSRGLYLPNQYSHPSCSSHKKTWSHCCFIKCKSNWLWSFHWRSHSRTFTWLWNLMDFGRTFWETLILWRSWRSCCCKSEKMSGCWSKCYSMHWRKFNWKRIRCYFRCLLEIVSCSC